MNNIKKQLQLKFFSNFLYYEYLLLHNILGAVCIIYYASQGQVCILIRN